MSGQPAAKKKPLELVPPPVGSVDLEDFYAYMPAHEYLFIPTRELWPGASVDARLPTVLEIDEDGHPVMGAHSQKRIKPSKWLDRNRPIEQMTWAPGEPLIVCDRLVADAGWVERPGARCFNLYRPPAISGGDPSKAGPWLDHVRTVYPDDADHILHWLAHRVQYPQHKINHALVFGGNGGIGKDTILAPVGHAIGPWNMGDISPNQLMGRFNGFLKCVILRVSEARDLGDIDRYAFYERSKIYLAAPPDVIRIDEKNLREYPIQNVCGVVITTNHKTNGLYLPADDRRHYVAWSELSIEDFDDAYFPALYAWFESGGMAHVAAWLHQHSLRGWNAKAPPPKTAAFWAIVDASRTPEDAEMADAITSHGEPDALTIAQLTEMPTPKPFSDWLLDRKNSRQIPHRLEKCGYVATRSPYAKDGLWVIQKRRCVVYVKADIPMAVRHESARILAEQLNQ